MRVKLSFFCMTICALIACNQTEEKPTNKPNSISPDVVNNPATASSDKGNSKNNIPVFQFADETHDFGKIIQGEKISYAFRFKNTGTGDLVIRAANGSCGCTVPEYPKEPIGPGKDGIINVTFNSEGKEGMQDKTVTLIANTVPNTKVLTITGEVIKPENK